MSSHPAGGAAPGRARLRVILRGAVQGVGFRPFVYRLANELGLAGWVQNSAQGVVIEVEGPAAILKEFQSRLERDKPALAFFQSLESVWLDPAGHAGFNILASSGGEKTALVMPDIATCPECRREVFDPRNRRYRYPFTNCTYCGPRFSIIEGLPYDRAQTTLRGFALCPICQAEYVDPANRRFHAQPTACPQCGPHLEYWDVQGRLQADHEAALVRAAAALRQGAIIALKGLGGFQLLVDARDEAAVARLRQRKHREAKPLAVMLPAMADARRLALVSDLEERLLAAPECPIVLLRKTPACAREIAGSVAPGNPYLGVMLPYTPLHHLLLAELGFPVVATSGNRSEEPLCTDEHQAVERLAGIADAFLVHNRPIARPVDDSVVRILLGRELVLRRARGYAPLPILLPEPAPAVLAVGAHLKSTVAIVKGRQAFLSQHLGDLETPQTFDAFQAAVASLSKLYDWRPEIIACDAHPDYRSTRFARQMAAASHLPILPVQHHYAHVLAGMAENALAPPVLGVAWDGTGFGLDGTIWGGEFLRVTATGFDRIGRLRPFRLPGGEAAIREPCRTALGLLFEIFGPSVFSRTDLASVRAFNPSERQILAVLLGKGLHCPVTSSAGRLFDGVAALLDLCQRSQFEGQAAMALEFSLDESSPAEEYPVQVLPKGNAAASEGAPAFEVDWEPWIRRILADNQAGVPAGQIAARFHGALAEAIVAVARLAGEPRVVLTGGCFQNCYLTEQAVARLTAAGFRPYWHQRVPPNDGGIALGQLWAAARHGRGG